jgi:phosphatidate phosphatase APP1
VTLFPAMGRPTLVTVSGRVVRGAPEAPAAPLARNAHRLLARSREGIEVAVTFAGQVRRVLTGDDGVFEASFPAPEGAPFPPGLQPVHAAVDGGAGEGRVDVISDAAAFLVISDFDDTLAVSNVQSRRGVVTSALLQDEGDQPAVEGMAPFYRCLREGSAPPPGLAVVSGSPLEYGARLEAFLARQGFPFAALHLRHLGLATTSGYKEPVIRALLSRFPQRVVLVGDSGEHDPEVYARIRGEFPGRVAGIFIRDVGRSADPARFAGMVLFRTGVDAALAAASQGLLAAGCAAALASRPGPAVTAAAVAASTAATSATAAVASTATATAAPLRPITTDGCSLFLDRDPVHGVSWRDCCVTHDQAYWRGGSEEERLRADEVLRACVAERTGDTALAELMFRGVRAGGLPQFPTWYRWGYGWSDGRGYGPLTGAERAAAAEGLARWQREQASAGAGP